MRVIPVIDIMDGVVVHAKMGQRRTYRPLRSSLCRDSDPIKLVKNLEKFGFYELYVADLNAIMGDTPNLDLLARLSKSDMQLMVDAGINNTEKAELIVGSGASKIIIGTETLTKLDQLKDILSGLGLIRVVISIDLMGSKVISRSPEIKDLRPEEVANIMESLGIEEIILLELSRVGSGKGVDLDLVGRVVHRIEGSLIVGGGIRSIGEINTLQKIGVSGVLIATALHRGDIVREDLRFFKEVWKNKHFL